MSMDYTNLYHLPPQVPVLSSISPTIPSLPYSFIKSRVVMGV